MKAVIVNGSPRRRGNTAELCGAFKSGIREANPECEIMEVALNDMKFRGCQSCFSCKLKGSVRYGQCALSDELSPVLEAVSDADCLVVASPIYLMDVSSATKAFLERICFSLGSYEDGYKSLAHKRTKVVTIYTMNTSETFAPTNAMDNVDMFLGHVFTSSQRLCAYNTYQFPDYSRYIVEVFDEREKASYRERHWTEVMAQAYALGRECGEVGGCL